MSIVSKKDEHSGQYWHVSTYHICCDCPPADILMQLRWVKVVEVVLVSFDRFCLGLEVIVTQGHSYVVSYVAQKPPFRRKWAVVLQRARKHVLP